MKASTLPFGRSLSPTGRFQGSIAGITNLSTEGYLGNVGKAEMSHNMDSESSEYDESDYDSDEQKDRGEPLDARNTREADCKHHGCLARD